MRAITVQLATTLLLAMAAPAMAQDATGTLRINGNIMISSGGDFVSARDGQPVVAGQRILVGDDSSATVEFASDCKRSFSSAGIHVIPPARCDNDRDDDRSQEREQSAEQGGAEGNAAASGAPAPWTTLATVLGGVAATAVLIEQQDDSPPDLPISR